MIIMEVDHTEGEAERLPLFYIFTVYRSSSYICLFPKNLIYYEL